MITISEFYTYDVIHYSNQSRDLEYKHNINYFSGLAFS